MPRLGDICVFQSGGTPSRNNTVYYNGDIPWITTVSLSGGIIGKEDAVEYITEQAIRESAAKIVPARSIMVGTRVGVGKVAINSVPMSTSQDIISLLCIDETKWDKEFLCKFILGKGSYLNSQARGATIKGIKIETLAKLDVPDISLEEQQHIAYVINEVNTLMLLRKSQLEQLDKLVKSRFIELFGDCVSNPKQWKTVCLDEIAEVGSSKRVFVEELKESGIPFYRGTEIGALAEGRTIAPELFITQEHYKSLCEATGTPKVGDLLMPSICPDGRIWVVNTTAPFYFKDGRVLWIHSIHSNYNPVFLLYTLKDRIMSDYSSIASGTTFAELKIFALKKCKVFDVPLAIQNEFATFIEQTDKLKLVIQNRVANREELKEMFVL